MVGREGSLVGVGNTIGCVDFIHQTWIAQAPKARPKSFALSERR